MRSFLRLEYLFKQFDDALKGKSVWSSRAALETIIEIHGLVSRSDLKTETLKELEKQTQNLMKLFENPHVNHQKLDHILLALDSLTNKIFSDNNPFGHNLKQNEFINAIKQRIAVPGGTCEMDMPTYHFWLQKPMDERALDINEWISGFENLRQAIELILQLIRDSATPENAIAEAGFFQRNLNSNNPVQLLRISIPKKSAFYAEISGGKHRFSVRFLQQENFESRPKQVSVDVKFELSCCII